MIVDDIKKIYNNLNLTNPKSMDVHKTLQNEIQQLAGNYNLKAWKEYESPQGRGDGRRGFIDVVWVSSDYKPVVAFEIDRAKRKYSIWKLLHINVKERYWIFYGSSESVELQGFLSQYDKDHLITIIHLPYYKEIFNQKPC